MSYVLIDNALDLPAKQLPTTGLNAWDSNISSIKKASTLMGMKGTMWFSIVMTSSVK